MSDSLYPTLPGLAWPVKRTPRWENQRARTASGRLFTATSWTFPIWVYTLKYEFLRRDVTYAELQDLANFFNVMRGGYDTFLFADPDDNAVAALQFGTGDGTTERFALLRTMGGASPFYEPIGWTAGPTEVTVNGTPTTAYTLVDNRIVEFDSPPAAAAVLRWTGSYRMRCIFRDDELGLEKFMAGFWSAGGVSFETFKP